MRANSVCQRVYTNVVVVAVNNFRGDFASQCAHARGLLANSWWTIDRSPVIVGKLNCPLSTSSPLRSGSSELNRETTMRLRRLWWCSDGWALVFCHGYEIYIRTFDDDDDENQPTDCLILCQLEVLCVAHVNGDLRSCLNYTSSSASSSRAL